MSQIKQIFPIFGHTYRYKYNNKLLEMLNELISIYYKTHKYVT